MKKEDFVAIDDLPIEVVEVPRWGCSVRLRALNGKERSKWESEVYTVQGRDVKVDFENLKSKLLIRAIIDDDGKRIFSDNDFGILNEKNAEVIDSLYNVASKLSGLRKEDTEELEKN